MLFRSWTESKHPKNLGSYFGYLNQAHYVDGVAAGLSTRSNKLGFVAAKPIASVLSNINSFMLGAKKTNPNAVVQVIFTGDWSLPVREAEAVNALVDAGNVLSPAQRQAFFKAWSERGERGMGRRHG